MLVLTRKVGEGIVIGDDVIIKVVEVKGGSVRIGIDAPKDRKIYRQQIYEKIMQENREASQWDINDLDTISSNLSSGKTKK